MLCVELDHNLGLEERAERMVAGERRKRAVRTVVEEVDHSPAVVLENHKEAAGHMVEGGLR